MESTNEDASQREQVSENSVESEHSISMIALDRIVGVVGRAFCFFDETKAYRHSPTSRGLAACSSEETLASPTGSVRAACEAVGLLHEEVLTWFTVAFQTAESLFFPASSISSMGYSISEIDSLGYTKSLALSDATSQGSPSASLRDHEISSFDLLTWRQLYYHGLVQALGQFHLSLPSDKLIQILQEVVLRAMGEWVNEPLTSSAWNCFSELFPNLCLEPSEQRLGAPYLNTILFCDTVWWISIWYPLARSLKKGIKVLWHQAPVSLLWGAVAPSPSSPHSGSLNPYEAFTVSDDEEAEPNALDPVAYECTYDPSALRMFFSRLDAVLRLEVRMKDDSGKRFRGAAVPTSWMVRFVRWVEECMRDERVNVRSQSSSAPGTAFPAPPGPIPTLEAVVLRQHLNPSNFEYVLKHSVFKYMVDGEFKEGGTDGSGIIEVVPIPVYHLLLSHFGGGHEYHLYGTFRYREKLLQLLQAPRCMIEVAFSCYVPPPADGAATMMKVGQKEVEVVSDNKLCHVTVEGYGHTTVIDVLRKGYLEAREQGEMSTPQERGLWLGLSSLRCQSTGGSYFDVEARGAEAQGEVSLRVSFLNDVHFPAVLEEDVVPMGPLPLDGSVEDILYQLREHMTANGKPWPLKDTDPSEVIELTLHATPTFPSDTENSYETVLLPGVCGLSNIGNTCFMNSSLQCLAHLDSFCQALFQESFSHIRLATVGAALQDLFLSMWTGRIAVGNTRNFKNQIGLRHSRYAGYKQEDASEFIDALLDSLSDELNTVSYPSYRQRTEEDQLVATPKLSELYWNDFLVNRTAWVSSMFYHQLKSKFECLVCGAHREVFEHDSMLSLPLPEIPRRISVSAFVTVEFTIDSPSPAWEEESCKEHFAHLKVMLEIPAGPKQSRSAAGIPPFPLYSIQEVAKGVQSSAVFANRLECLVRDHQCVADTVCSADKQLSFQSLWEHEGVKAAYFFLFRYSLRRSVRLTPPPPLLSAEACPSVPPSVPVWFCFHSTERHSFLDTRSFAIKPACVETFPLGEAGELDTVAPISAAILDRAEELGAEWLSRKQQEEISSASSSLWPYVSDEGEEGKVTSASESADVEARVFALNLAAEYDEDSARFVGSERDLGEYGASERPWLIEIVSIMKRCGDRWVLEYLDAMRGMSSPAGTGSDAREMVVCRGNSGSSVAPAGSQPPLLVVIAFNEAKCSLNISFKSEYRIRDEASESRTEAYDSTLDKCLKAAFQTPQTLSGEDAWRCPRCADFVTAHLTRTIFRLPTCLIVSFQRFKQEEYTVMKNDALVWFPETLDLQEYLDEEAEQAQASLYRLKSVVYHSGTLDFGHYTAWGYVSTAKSWGVFNDRDAGLSAGLPPYKNAYVLCYEREEADTKENA